MATCADDEYHSVTQSSWSGSDDSENGDSSSVLSLCYSSSPFASQATSSSSDVDEESHTVEPYLYEPTDDEGSSDEAGESSDDESSTERLGNTEW